MRRYFIGVDNGGTMTKAAVFDAEGRELASASKGSVLLTPSPGFTERDMEALWQDTAGVIREAVQKSGAAPEEIAALACTGHGKGLYLWGRNGAPVRNGIVSTDTRAREYLARWNSDGTAERAYGRSLQKLQVSQPCALLAWLKDNEPDSYASVRWIFEVKDYIRFRLTGESAGEITDYSGTNLMNLRTRNYDPELLNLFGIPEMLECLPPLVTATRQCGAVTPAAAAETGLVPGIPVAGGMFDIDACAIGSGVTDERDLCVIAGTWSINEYASTVPVEDGKTMNSIFCLPEYYLVEESSPTSAGNLEWFVKTVLDCERKQAAEAGESIYTRLDRLVEETSPEECQILFLPYLFGAPDAPQATAAFYGMAAGHSKAQLIRAIFEGIVFGHRDHVEKLLAHRNSPGCIRLSGGAANSKVWVQMFADILGLPVETVPVREPGALGCAIAGAVAAGIYPDCAEAARRMVPRGFRVEPDPGRTGIYNEKYRRFGELKQALSSLS